MFAADAVFFTLAISLAIALASVELFGLLLGISPSGAISQRLTGSSDAEVKIAPAPRRFFGWFSFGHLPALITLALLLSVFGGLGLLEQWFAKHLLGLSLHPVIAVIPAAILALAMCNCAGRAISRLKQADALRRPQNVNFIGRIATLTLGAATVGRPARAKLVDLEGRVHHVLVEPVDVNQTLPEGSEVVVVRQEGSILRVTTHSEAS